MPSNDEHPLVAVYGWLAKELARLSFSTPVAHVYNPLIYAREPHELYLTRYGSGAKEAVFLGMNPGPWGMAQTGVPFGEIGHVRDWLRISGTVDKPVGEHPKKKVTGFACKRSEVSGLRLWGLFQERHPDPADFFRRFFVLNYCPLLFLDAEGRNITPDKLKAAERQPLEAACNEALRRAVAVLGAEKVVGVGAFAEAQAAEALSHEPVRILRVLHPSPSNPQANKNWKGIVLEQLQQQGIEL